MPFTYDKVQLCIAFFHPKEQIPQPIQDLISQVATTMITSNGNAVDLSMKKRATDLVLTIRNFVHKYLHSHLSLDYLDKVVAPDGEKLKEKGLARSLKVAKFSRYVLP